MLRCSSPRGRLVGSSGIPEVTSPSSSGQLLRPEPVAFGHVLLSGSGRDDFVAVDGQREQRGGERLSAGADLYQGVGRERSTRVGSFSIWEEVAMAVQRNRDERARIRRSPP